jgi:hypothetical protein
MLAGDDRAQAKSLDFESETTMTNVTYAAGHTALLIVDPYNDFLSEGGKLYNAIKSTADESGLFDNLRKIIPAFRADWCTGVHRPPSSL